MFRLIRVDTLRCWFSRGTAQYRELHVFIYKGHKLDTDHLMKSVNEFWNLAQANSPTNRRLSMLKLVCFINRSNLYMWTRLKTIVIYWQSWIQYVIWILPIKFIYIRNSVIWIISASFFSLEMFYFVLFYSILFYSIILYSIMFYSIILYSIMFYSIRLCSIQSYSIIFHYILFDPVLFYVIILRVII